MKQIFFLMLISVIASCGNTQPGKSAKKLTGDITSDLKILLPSGKVTADIMDSIKQTPRQAELTKKFQLAIAKNYDWFLDYMKTIPQGEPMPYHEKLGLTKSEYSELMNFMNNAEITSSGKEEISINVNDNVISFKSHGRLHALDSLSIDLTKNVVSFGHTIIPFSDTLNVKTDKNGLRTKWKGYAWNLEQPNNLGVEDLKDLSSLMMKQYQFRIGKLENNGKTYMSLKCREVQNGIKTFDIEIPIEF